MKRIVGIALLSLVLVSCSRQDSAVFHAKGGLTGPSPEVTVKLTLNNFPDGADKQGVDGTIEIVEKPGGKYTMPLGVYAIKWYPKVDREFLVVVPQFNDGFKMGVHPNKGTVIGFLSPKEVYFCQECEFFRGADKLGILPGVFVRED